MARSLLLSLLITSLLTGELLLACSPNDEPDVKDNPPPDCPTCSPSMSCPTNGGPTGEDPTTDDPVYLTRGSALESAVDLSLPGPIQSWSHPRKYDSLLIVNGGGELSAVNGVRWTAFTKGHYIKEASGGDIDLFLVGSTKRTFVKSGSNYNPPRDYTTVLDRDGFGADETLTLREPDTGNVYVFAGFNASVPAHNRGKLLEQTTRQYKEQGLSGIEYTYSSSTGFLTQVTTADPQGWTINYTYYSSGAELGQLQKIEVLNGASTVVQKAEYTYYGNVTSPSSDLGTTNNLVQVKVSKLASDGTNWTVRYTQYRYYTGTSGTRDGSTHQLKMVLESDAIERINQAGNADVDTPEELLTKADTYTVTGSIALRDYANRRFTYYTSDLDTGSSVTTDWGSENLSTKYGGANVNEYDASAYGRVKSETVNGSCSTCGGSGAAGVTKTYYYMNLHGGTSTTAGEIVQLIVEDTTDSNGNELKRTIWGANTNSNVLRTVTILDPTQGTLTAWCKSYLMNSDLRVTEQRSPSAHTLVDTDAEVKKFLDPTVSTNDADTLNSSDGLITVYEYDTNKRLNGVRVKKGSSGTAYYVSAIDYGDGSTTPAHLRTATYTYPTQTTTRSAGVQTTIAYTFWDTTNKNQIKKQTVTLPSIASGQNGPGVSAVTEQYFDKKGRLRWTKDALGYVNYYSYHPNTGGLAYTAIDVDPSSMPGSSTGNDTKWDPSTQDGDGNGTYDSSGIPTRSGAIGTALALVSQTEFDSLGRPTLRTDAAGAKHYTVYQATRTIQFPYWDSANSKCLQPIQITVLCDCGQVDEQIAVKGDYASISVASSAPTGFSTEPSQSDYVRWTRYDYDDLSNKLATVDTYHDIPSSGTGTLSTNFHRTIMQYDDEGRPTYTIQTVSGTSTSTGVEQVTQRVYDVLGRVTETKMGVSNASHDMTSTYTTYPTLRTVAKSTYDAGGVGDSLVTKSQRFHGTGANDYTGVNYKLTYRGHLRGHEPFYHNGTSETAAGPYTVIDVDWRGLATAQGQYTVNPTWTTVLTGDGYTNFAASTATNRRALTETSYDDLGRTYKSSQFAINTSTGAKGSAIQTDNFYDLAGQLVATAQLTGGMAQEFAYDAAGRQYQTRSVLQLNSTKYSSGAFQYQSPTPHPTRTSMTGGDDSVVTLSHSVFDSAGNVTEQHAYEMNHDDGTAGIDLTNNDDYVRRTVYSWYDAANRVTTTGDYGSGDTAAGAGYWKYAAVPSRGSAPTASSDTVLVTKYAYDAATGDLYATTDPNGKETRTFDDDLGRTVWVAEHYANFDPATLSTISDGSDASKDRVTKTEYDGLGNTTKQIAYNGSSSVAEDTQYLYEDAVDARRVTSTIYPDSSDTTSAGTDQVKVTYNVDGTPSQRTDQRGTVIAYSYDTLRRPQSQKVTTLGGATDGTVRSLTTKYDTLGRVSKQTSHGNQTDDPDNTSDIKNQVVPTYNDLSLITKSEQSHSGAVGMSTPSVQYAYDTSAVSSVFDDGPRLESLTYPSGRVLFSDYGTADALADRLGVPEKLRETDGSGTILSQYSRTGRGAAVITDYQQPDVKLDLFGGTTSTYAGLDRFGRVVDQFWDGYNSTADVERLRYAYDSNGNQTYRDRDAAIYATNDKDLAFAYDGLNRLLTSDVGTLSGTTISGTPKTEEDWTLDQLNNWPAYVTKTNGATVLNQSRTHNDANELTQIDSASTYVAHDAAGNMTTVPKPGSWSAAYTLTYDAWNRLVKVQDGANTVAEYQYDARNRRIVKKLYTGGVLSQTRDRYHSEEDQVLEERVDASTNPDRQFTWGARYVDDLVLRTRDTDANGTLDETLYALQDSTWNVTTLTSASGAVQERFQYDPFGRSTVLDANFATDGDGVSDVGWEYRFTAREFDSETGLHYFRARHYHDGVGRFVQRDPIGYVDGYNLYAGYFVPARVDPTGLGYITGIAWFPDPDGGVGFFGPPPRTPPPESFYECRARVQQKGMARCFGCSHTAIYGSSSGLVYDCWFGAPLGSGGGGGLPTNQDCVLLNRADSDIVDHVGGWISFRPKRFRWGPKSGQLCAGASSNDIRDCLRAKPAPGGTPNIAQNCQTDCFEAAEGCCLRGLAPLTVFPPRLPPPPRF